MRFLALLCLAGGLLAQAPRKAPSFTLPDTNSNFHDLTDYRGKVVVLEMMRTNCPHCVAFSKVLEQIHRQYAGRVQVFSIANPPDTLELLKQYIATAKMTFPILMDCGQASFSYVRSGTVNLPRVWIIDRAGMIRQDVTYSDQTKPFFEKRGVFTELDKILAAK
jgi:peroxiredoxin